MCGPKQGQPWLVNALAYEACFEMNTGRDRTQLITLELMKTARERLIQRRDTHLDQLLNKLQEPRVHRIISQILNSDVEVEQYPTDEVQYVEDLGLIKRQVAANFHAVV